MLACLSLSADNHSAVIEHDGLNAIVQLARSEHTELQKLALQALSTMAENSDLHNTLVVDYDVIGLMQTLCKSSALIGVQFSVALLYNLLSMSESHGEKIIRSGLEGLMLLVKHKMKQVREHAIKALARLALAHPEQLMASDIPLARDMAIQLRNRLASQGRLPSSPLPSASAIAAPGKAFPLDSFLSGRTGEMLFTTTIFTAGLSTTQTTTQTNGTSHTAAPSVAVQPTEQACSSEAASNSAGKRDAMSAEFETAQAMRVTRSRTKD